MIFDHCSLFYGITSDPNMITLNMESPSARNAL